MKSRDLILLAGAGLAAYVLLRTVLVKKSTTTGNSSANPSSNLSPWVYEITKADGWTYYSDGTTIGPDGKYYKGSDLVYNPAGMYQ